MALADIYQKATLVQIPSGYKSGTLYSVVPNTTAGDFTVSVDADATRVNKYGLVESVSANQARLNYDPTNPQDPHLLLEPSRLNYIGYSAQFDNSYWSKATSDSTPNPTITANAGVSPDGGLNADRVQATAAPNNSWAVVKRDGINTGATVGSKLQQSLYLKAYDSSQVGKNVDIYMYDFSNTRYYTVYQYTLTSDWKRVVVEHTISGANTSTNIQFAFGKARSTVGGSLQSETATDFLVWGGQLEKGNFPTSYIPTATAAAVTRTVDSCLNGGDANLFNDSEGTLFVEARIFDKNDTSSKNINISSGNNSNYIAIEWTSSSKIVFSLYNGSYQVLTDTTAYNTEEYLKIAFRYKQNDVAIYVNGNLVATDTNASMFADGTLTTLDFRIGTLPSDYYFYGNLKQLMYFNTGLSNTELQTLTS